MKAKDKQAYWQKDVSSLQAELDQLARQLVVKQMERKLGKLKQTHLIRQIRYKIALIKTIISHKQANAERSQDG